LRPTLSASVFNFHFADYKVGSADYSGNELTGVPGEVIVAGLDLVTALGVYFNITFNYTSAIPLTDQNDVYSSPYRLWQGRLGWRREWKHHVSTDFFIGIDNAANELYSLGNDINAFGRRYYNPAADRNYYGGVRFSF
jgi:iron complex outermembrane receptor protein